MFRFKFKRTGRKPMKKMFLETETETEEIVDDDANNNDEERYFKDNFVFMDSSQKNKQLNPDDG